MAADGCEETATLPARRKAAKQREKTAKASAANLDRAETDATTKLPEDDDGVAETACEKQKPGRSKEELKEIVPNDVLFGFEQLEEVHKHLNGLRDAGRITSKERQLLLKRWQARLRLRKIFAERKTKKNEEKLEKKGRRKGEKAKKSASDSDEAPIEPWIREQLAECSDVNEVKVRLNELAEAGKLPAKEVGALVKKWKRSEWRRQRRSNMRASHKLCFSCRQPGHSLADCPANQGKIEDDSNEVQVGSAAGVCFKCGSTEHSVHKCRSKVQGYPYAHCFVCGQTGHLSRDCERNPHGAFPMGGGCNLCGEKNHLKKDCPLLGKDRPDGKAAEITLKIDSDPYGNPDVEQPLIEESSEAAGKKKRKKVKVVKF